MATLTVQSVSESGLNASYAAASGGGDEFADDGEQRTFLHVKNGGGGSVTVTVTAQTTTRSVPGMGTMTKANASVSVPAGGERFIGPFPAGAFKNSAGRVAVGYSGVTSVTVAAIRVPQV